MHVEAWLQRAARRAPHTTAIEAHDGCWSYAELFARAATGAGELRERGVRVGDRVAIALPTGARFAQALHACILLGALAVPLDPRLTREEQDQVAAGAVLRVDEPLAGRGDVDLPADGDPPTEAGDGDPPSDSDPPTGGEDPAPPRFSHELDAPAVVIHTSGTTSAPKPVELTYGNFLWSALGSAVALGIDPDERWLCALPSSHVGGLSILVRSAIYATTAVVHERFHTGRVLASLQRDSITLVSLVSTTLARLLDAGLRKPPALRCALTGGGPVPAALVERARHAGVAVRETYGLTECCSQATTAPAESERPGAGVPLFCTRVRTAADGEILLSGPTLAPSALGTDGWLHTGDMGRLDEHGFLRVTGRKADTIISGGENVSPSEVEAILEAHPGVLEAAVLGRPDPQWGEAVHAIVVLAPGVASQKRRPNMAGMPADSPPPLSQAQLRAHCAARLAPYKIPKHFTLVSQPLPRTGSGKLLRRELQ